MIKAARITMRGRSTGSQWYIAALGWLQSNPSPRLSSLGNDTRDNDACSILLHREYVLQFEITALGQ